jgi:magnesium-transporting ATPase (P-type)
MTGDGIMMPLRLKLQTLVSLWESTEQGFQEAADMILDDNFATIITAVRHGRVILTIS